MYSKIVEDRNLSVEQKTLFIETVIGLITDELGGLEDNSRSEGCERLLEALRCKKESEAAIFQIKNMSERVKTLSRCSVKNILAGYPADTNIYMGFLKGGRTHHTLLPQLFTLFQELAKESKECIESFSLGLSSLKETQTKLDGIGEQLIARQPQRTP